MSTTTNLKGSCLCASTTYTLTPPTAWKSVICHCTSCTKASGSVLSANLLFPRSAITILQSSMTIYTEPNTCVERRFCKICGSGLFVSSPEKSPEMVSVMRGCLDLGGEGTLGREFDPQVEFFGERKVDWVTVHGVEDRRRRMEDSRDEAC